MKKIKNQKGITLIALIVTIIVILILVGVTIVSLTGEQGLIGRANTAQIQNLTAGYIEEINFEVTNEKIDRTGKEKEKSFIISIKNRLEGKSWVKQITASDESLRTDIPDADKNLLVVNTKEDFVIMVNIDNNKLSASINGTSDKYETYTITYIANNGTEETTTQEVIKGLELRARGDIYEKQYHSFAGWCENQAGEGTRYVNGSIIPVDGDKTLYAIWTKERVGLNFDANTGNGTMEEVEVGMNTTISYPVNSGITKVGYIFMGWNTAADGSGTNYLDSEKENIQIQIGEENVTLYAQWEAITYDITYALDGGTATNPATYTADTDTFTLSRPVKEGYTFLGWTGTGLESATKAVTIEKGSEGDRSYTATWYEGYMAYTLGQEVTIGDEQFFVIEASDANQNTVTALAKYNLNSAGTAQANVSAYYYRCYYSTSKYWTDGLVDLNPIESSAALVVNRAKAYGISKGGSGRLMILSEFDSLKSSILNILMGKNYSSGRTSENCLRWYLASPYSTNSSYVAGVNGGEYNRSWYWIHQCSSDNRAWPPDSFGCRPVITVSKHLVS